MFENIKFMTPVDKYISEKILENKEAFLNYKISDFAKLISVSSSALSRFVRKGNFNSYTDLKLYISKYTFSQNDDLVKEKNNETALSLKNIHKLYSESISEVSKISKEKLNQITDEIIGAEYSLIYGLGSSKLGSMHLVSGLHKLGIRANFNSDFHNFIRLLEKFRKSILIIFSESFDSMEVDFLLKEAKNLNIKTWVITAHGEKINSLFVRYISFKTFNQKDAFMSGTSKISMLFISDSILYTINDKMSKNKKHSVSSISERWKNFSK